MLQTYKHVNSRSVFQVHLNILLIFNSTKAFNLTTEKKKKLHVGGPSETERFLGSIVIILIRLRILYKLQLLWQKIR